jgi:hypothetical protein
MVDSVAVAVLAAVGYGSLSSSSYSCVAAVDSVAAIT